MSIAVCVVLASGSALYSLPAQAQSASWYFVSICGVPNPIDCPWGPSPAEFGPFPSLDACIAAHDQWQNGYFGTHPRTLSTCYTK
jgi:hypothetical protein